MDSKEFKTCNICHEAKPLDQFYKAAKWLEGKCKACKHQKTREYRKDPRVKKMIAANAARAFKKLKEKETYPEYVEAQKMKQRKLKYGVTAEQFESMLINQNSACAICEVPFNDNPRSYGIDHSHETGAVRGILCTKCNSAIGMLKENPYIFLKALGYLQEHRKKPTN